MRAVLQRVLRAKVTVGTETAGSIDRGFLVLLGIGAGDSTEDAELLADRIPVLRVFPNAEGKFDLSLAEVKGSALVVSQFTLFADTSRGRRPSFSEAAPPEKAVPLYEHFVARLGGAGITTATGRFGADMQIEMVADGPVTLVLESGAMRRTA